MDLPALLTITFVHRVGLAGLLATPCWHGTYIGTYSGTGRVKA